VWSVAKHTIALRAVMLIAKACVGCAVIKDGREVEAK